MKILPGGGLRAAPFLLAALLFGGCASDPALVQRIHDLDQVVIEQRKRNDELREKVAAADREVAAARVEVDRLKGRDEAYRAAQEALEQRIKEMEGAFQAPAGSPEEGGIAIEKIAGGFKFVVQGEVLFGTGEADLTEEGKAAVGKIANALRGRTERIRVEGHTDSVPISKPATKEKYPFGNLDLSLDRALHVADALVKGGVEAKRVSCGGHGEHQPRSENGTAEGRKKNRRVEILVQGD